VELVQVKLEDLESTDPTVQVAVKDVGATVIEFGFGLPPLT